MTSSSCSHIQSFAGATFNPLPQRSLCTSPSLFHGRRARDRLSKVQKCSLSSSSSSSSNFKVCAMTSGYSPRRPRREPLPSVSELDLQEQVAAIDMDPNKMLQPGDPNTLQAIVRDVMPVGYFVNLPTGREGYLPAQDLGFNGGLAILQRLFKVGQEITVRIVCRGGAGREILSVKRPEFAPPSEQKTIESMRLHFENERKGANRPRRRR